MSNYFTKCGSIKKEKIENQICGGDYHMHEKFEIQIYGAITIHSRAFVSQKVSNWLATHKSNSRT